MSASFGSDGGGKGGSQDFDLNLAPIIDAFTVLITFLLVSAAFLSIGFFDAGISAAGQQSKPGTPPPITISLSLEPNYVLKLQVTGKQTSNWTLQAQDGTWNMKSLADRLGELKAKWSQVGSLTLTADNKTTYKDVVLVMEQARKTIPLVLLGGF